jgi:hypothetical protein
MAPPSDPLLHPVTTETARRDASAAFDELKKALVRHGIWLPDLDVDLVSYAHFAGRPLIQLGRISNEAAKALTGVLNRAEVGSR